MPGVAATFIVAIQNLPIGSRVLAINPRPEEFDDSFSEPVQSEWARVSFLIVRNDLSLVEAEFIRPRAWIESVGLVKGARIDLAVPELGIDGLAEVTAVRDCPPIAEGEGRVVTGRFVTRDVANVVRITLANGTRIRATDVHPVWSVDREDWVPAGKLEPGEHVDTLTGPVAVVSVETLDRHPAVYNLEVHGEHVYRIAVDGVLVHNAGPSYTLGLSLTDDLADFASGARAAGRQAGHIVPWGNFSNRIKPVRLAILDAKEALAKAGIGLNDSWNGFWTSSSTHLGTHRNEFFLELGNRLKGLTNKSDVLAALGNLRDEILNGKWACK